MVLLVFQVFMAHPHKKVSSGESEFERLGMYTRGFYNSHLNLRTLQQTVNFQVDDNECTEFAVYVKGTFFSLTNMKDIFSPLYSNILEESELVEAVSDVLYRYHIENDHILSVTRMILEIPMNLNTPYFNWLSPMHSCRVVAKQHFSQCEGLIEILASNFKMLSIMKESLEEALTLGGEKNYINLFIYQPI